VTGRASVEPDLLVVRFAVLAGLAMREPDSNRSTQLLGMVNQLLREISVRMQRAIAARPTSSDGWTVP
jgi:hypothetical protein